MSYTEDIGIEFIEASAQRVTAVMHVDARFHQPFGFVHGGVTLALLESVASKGAEFYADLECERPFGIHIDVGHRKSAREGMLRGVAEFDHAEGFENRTQVWRVAAFDDVGDVVSEGTFKTKVVTLERLRQKGIEA